MPIEQSFNIKAAARLTGHSAQMLDYLCRTEIVIPKASKQRRRGVPRKYTYKDLLLLRTVRHLLDRGVSVARLKNDLKKLRNWYGVVEADQLTRRFMVTDGQRVYFKKRDDIVEDLSTGQFAFSFIVDMQQITEEVGEALEQLKR